MQLVEDIDPRHRANLQDLDVQQQTVVNRVALALDGTNEPNVKTATLLAEILRTFLGTHFSIRLLLSKRDERPELAADAVSLVREQIEKVFLISLLLADWETYVPIYFQEDWCHSFRYYVVEKRERERLPRSEQFFSEIFPKHLEEQRKRNGISEAVRDLIEFQVMNPGAKKPKELSGIRLPQLPKPSQIIDRSSVAERASLARWYEEYKLVCGYTHVGADKLLMTTATGRKVDFSTEQVQMLFRKILVEKAALSYVACAYAATELLSRTGNALEPAAEVMKLWNLLLEASLVARVFWELRSRTLLPLAGLGVKYSVTEAVGTPNPPPAPDC